MSKKHVSQCCGSGYNIVQTADNKYLTIMLENNKLDKDQVESLIIDLTDFVKTMAESTTITKENGKVVIKQGDKIIGMQG